MVFSFAIAIFTLRNLVSPSGVSYSPCLSSGMGMLSFCKTVDKLDAIKPLRIALLKMDFTVSPKSSKV